MRKKILLLSSVGLLATGAVALLATNASSTDSFSIAGGSSSWNHYEAVAATCESYGIKEYWTDCNGNTTIEEPVGAVIVEKGQPSAADIQYIVDTYGADDERIIAKSDTHSYVNTVVTDKIGYFGTVCSVCGLAGELSSDKMEFADIDFTKATYGANGGKWGTNVQPTAKTMTYEVNSGAVEDEIFLPKINFALFKSITFAVSGNVWDARVGLESGSYAFPYSASGAHTGTLSFTVGQNQVDVALECAEGTNQNAVITDADIISGEKSFSMFMIADDPYRTITIELTGLIDECSHTFEVDPSCLGKEICSICGEARALANPTVDFATNGIYGMYDWYKSFGAPDPSWVTATAANNIQFYSYNAGVITEICLPKMYFAGFEAVTIDLTIANASEKYSFESDMSVLFTVPSTSYAAKLVFYNISSTSMVATLRDSSDNILLSKVVGDASILNGLDGFKFYLEGVGLGVESVSNFTFIGEHEHNYVIDSNCIGREVCSTCYAEHGVAAPTFDFTANAYGAADVYEPWGEVAQAGWARPDNAGQISYAEYTQGDICVFYLPRIYFYGFSSVSIDIAANYEGLVYSLDHGFTTSYATPFAGYPLKLVFESISQSSMTVKILDAFDFPQVTATCNDVNVLSGAESFALFVKGTGPVGWDAFSNFTFVA